MTPLVLLIDDQEWTSRSIESILRPKGHVVLKAYTARQAMDLLQKVSPDALLVDIHLPDVGGIDLVRQLRETPTIHATTPILMITGGNVGRAERLEALGAGAWDVLTHPVEPNELVLRLETFIRAKQEADVTRDEGLTDASTGFYNARGLLRKATEIGADAIRFDRPVTCIAFGPQAFGQDIQGKETLEDIARRIAAALRSVTRLSDTVGRLGPNEFAIVAPGTDQDGAVRLADRVLEALDRTPEDAGLIDSELLKEMRAGLYAVHGHEPTSPEDLLLRATVALRRAQTDKGSFRVQAYDA